MATSQQKDKLSKEATELLGISNVDFSKYNYKPNKALQKVIDLITENLRGVELSVVKDGNSTLLVSLVFEGCYDALTKPNIKTIYSVSATEWHPTKIELLVGGHHAGFDGLILAVEVIRHASKNDLRIKREVKDISSAKRIIENTINCGSLLMLSNWNHHELGYIYRQCGVSEVDLDAFANHRDESVDIQVHGESIRVEFNGVCDTCAWFKLRFIDDVIVGFDLNKCNLQEVRLFKAWLLVRRKNLKDLYQQALFEQKRDTIKKRLASGNETMDVIRQMVITSSQIACGRSLEPAGSFEELDKLAEQYLKLRKANTA